LKNLFFVDRRKRCHPPLRACVLCELWLGI